MSRARTCAWIPILLLSGRLTAGQAPTQPHLEYVYPAGGQAGTTVVVELGGTRIGPSDRVVISGNGIRGSIDQVATDDLVPVSAGNGKKKRDRNAAQIRATLTIAPEAEPGRRNLWLVQPGAVSDAATFVIGTLPEVAEPLPVPRPPPGPDGKPASEIPRNRAANNAYDHKIPALPMVANGRILPGEIDRWTFEARQGQHLVLQVEARSLMPYIADAVPGWFQAALIVYDAQGRELAYADDCRQDPDPVLAFTVPADGRYTVAVRDGVHRGREDFVYRLRVGELPFLTGVFPLGGRPGQAVLLELAGYNLPTTSQAVALPADGSTALAFQVNARGQRSNLVPLALADLPTFLIPARPGPYEISAPMIVDGRLAKPGAVAEFRFPARAGQDLIVDVLARRLGSPLDGLLTICDPSQAVLATQDDRPDPAYGLLTDQADPGLRFQPPASGTYTLRMRDLLGRGGPEYGYRLRISPPCPDFAPQAVPAAVVVPVGGAAALQVQALRQDGFDGPLTIRAAPASAGIIVQGLIPARAATATITVQAASDLPPGPIELHLLAEATIDGRTVIRPVRPAEDRMQAFIYHHLVPCQAQMVLVEPAAPVALRCQPAGQGPLTIAPGGKVSLQVQALRQPGFIHPIQLSLLDPPPGLSASRGGIAKERDQGRLELQVDAKAAPIHLATLVVVGTSFIETGPADADGRIPRRRLDLVAPAIPLRVQPRR